MQYADIDERRWKNAVECTNNMIAEMVSELYARDHKQAFRRTLNRIKYFTPKRI